MRTWHRGPERLDWELLYAGIRRWRWKGFARANGTRRAFRPRTQDYLSAVPANAKCNSYEGS